jgi:hypothetical protein
MAESKNPASGAPDSGLLSGEIPEQVQKEVQVNYRPKPSRRPAGRDIHPRQNIPAVPEGKEVPDPTPSPPVDLD